MLNHSSVVLLSSVTYSECWHCVAIMCWMWTWGQIWPVTREPYLSALEIRSLYIKHYINLPSLLFFTLWCYVCIL